MAQNTNDLSKQYYSVTPIQELEQITEDDLTINSEQDGGGVDLIPIGLHGRSVSNSISIKNLQNAIDTTGYIPQEAKSGDNFEQTTGGLMSQQDKWNLDQLKNGEFLNLKNGNTQGSLRSVLSSSQDEEYQLGRGAFAEGYHTKAIGAFSHAENFTTTSQGNASHAEGSRTKAIGDVSHAEGVGTKAIGDISHAEGFGTQASGIRSHAEGSSTVASGDYSHASNFNTIAEGDFQTAIGKSNLSDINNYAFIIGNGTEQNRSNALTVDWDGKVESFGGYATQDNHLTTKEYVDNIINNAINNIDIGLQNLEDSEATGSVQGIASQATGDYSFAEGYGTIASGIYSHAEGTIDDLERNISSGFASHTEGVDTQASNYGAHAEGAQTIAQGIASHAEGYGSQAIGSNSHASGRGTIANADNETVIGQYNKITGIQEVREDISNIRLEGSQLSYTYNLTQIPVENTTIHCYLQLLNDQAAILQQYHIIFTAGVQQTINPDSYLQGIYNGNQTITFSCLTDLTLTKEQIIGIRIQYNVEKEKNNNLFVIGNGTDSSHRSNAFEIDKTGNVTIQGDIAVQGDIINSSNRKYIPFPVGSIQIYAGSICPNGWMFCDGREVNRTEYSKLFEALGGENSRWGIGDGSTTFNIPDLRGRFPLGFNGNSLPNGSNSNLSVRNFGSKDGKENVSIEKTNLPAHTHSIPNGQFSSRWTLDGGSNHLLYGGSGLFSTQDDTSSTAKPVTFNASATSTASKGRNIVKVQNQNTGSVGSGTPLNIMPPYAVINFIIYHGKED